MSSSKLSMILLALVAGAALAQAAGGIKGAQRAEASGQRVLGLKRPQQPLPPQQQYLPPPPPPAAAPLPPPPQAPIKGPGQVAPVFTAARIQAPVVLAPQPQEQQVQVQVQEQEPEQQQQIVQQTQQQEEIDPNAAAQDSAPAIAAPAVAAPAGAANEEEANPRPEPYAFNYAFDAGDSVSAGSSQREEQQDANGRVTGFYTLRGEDGRDRRVDYVADADGFRATVSTNEMGTANKDSADVDWQAQSPTDAQLRTAESATQAARQRALLNPQPQQQQQQQLQQQQVPAASSSSSKVTSPRHSAAAAASSQQRASIAQQQSSKGQQQQQQQQTIQQLQEPFEQIRQTELNARARKSRHAPFYLYTV